MSMETVHVPDIGSDGAVDVIEVPVKVGDVLAAEATIVILESDKATVEVPLPMAGTVSKLLVKTGDRVRQGDPLLEMETGAVATQQPLAEAPVSAAPAAVPVRQPEPSRPAPVAVGAEQESVQATEIPVPQALPSSAPVHAGPAVRKLARELGVDLSVVRGSGPRERILRDDVHGWVKQRLSQTEAPASAGMSALPVIDFSRFGPVERIELNKLRKVSAANLHRSWLTIPHVTQHDDADITELESFRQSENARLQKEGVKLTMLAFLVRACAVALEKFPRFNSSLTVDGEALIQKQYIHIGVAVETENGLMVPVLRDANKKGVVRIAAEVAELAAKARNRKLTPADMQGGTFSISSLGGIGGTAFTPIVNWPEVAILGVSKAEMKPRWNGKDFEARLMLPLSLSYDHRLIDGADAARFITFLNQLLTDMRRALL